MGESKRKNKQQTAAPAKGSKNSATTFIIILAIVSVIGYDYYHRNKVSPLENFDPKRTKGEVDAPLQIMEFADFQCFQCARGAEFLNEYMEENPGRIRLSMNFFPLGELNSAVSAEYAHCASEQDKFWEYHDELFSTQNEWRTLLKVRPYLKKLGEKVGLDVDKLVSCSEGKKAKTVVQKNKALGTQQSVRSTPTYFVNGEMFVGTQSLRMKINEYFENNP